MASKTRCPDFAAILRVTEPDASILEQVASCFHQELNRHASRRCHDQTMAEDVTQDALVTALESLGSFRGDAPLDRWLKRLVVSSCSRMRRGRKNDPAYNLPFDETLASPGSENPSHDQEAKVFLDERIALLHEALEELPEDNRNLLMLHEGGEIPLAELAATFGLTVDGVKARLRRTRALLRSRLIDLAEVELPFND